MNRTFLWAVSAILLGAAAGAALGYWEAQPWAMRAIPAPAPADALPADAEASAHAVVEGGATFNFGNMETGTSQGHVYPIRNTGKAPLKVTFLSHTCKCTTIKLNGKPVEEDGEKIDANATILIPPGGTGEAYLEWTAQVPAGPFRHGAKFETSDPAMSHLDLNVEGEIVASTTLAPAQLIFGNVPATKPGKAELMVLAFLEPEVKILSHEILPEQLAKQVKVTIEPVPKDKLPDPTAKAGARVTAVYQPSGVLGAFGGSLKLTTNLKQAPNLDVPIYGTVKGDISILGKGWTESAGTLRPDPVRSAEGGVLKLNVAIRGEHADDTEIRIAKVDPPVLKASLGDRKTMRENLIWIPLTIEIPAGTRPMVRAGEDQGGEGEIVLATTHPTTSEVRLRVLFTVQP
jgi:hypothetical protein